MVQPIAVIYTCVVFVWVRLGRHGGGGIKVERNEQQSDRADTHDQHMFYAICFDIEKVSLFYIRCLVSTYTYMYIYIYMYRIVLHVTHETSYQKVNNEQWTPTHPSWRA